MVYTAFIDLDDTLLDQEKKISDYTLGALQEFQMHGNHVVFATCRVRNCTLKTTSRLASVHKDDYSPFYLP